MNNKADGYEIRMSGSTVFPSKHKTNSVSQNNPCFEVKSDDCQPGLLQAALSLWRKTHFDYDLGCKFQANHQGPASVGGGAAYEHLYESKWKDSLQLNQFGSTQSSYFIELWIWILSIRQRWPPLWLSVACRSEHSSIVIFSAESHGFELPPSSAEWCKWFVPSVVRLTPFSALMSSWRLSEGASLGGCSPGSNCTSEWNLKWVSGATFRGHIIHSLLFLPLVFI